MDTNQNDLKERLALAFETLNDVYMQCKEDDFIKLIAQLHGDEQLAGSALEVARHFDKDKLIFRSRYLTQTLRFEDEYERIRPFLEALDGFKPGKKGAQGGFTRIRDFLIEKRNDKADMLRDYKELKNKSNLTEKEHKRLENYDKSLPEHIRKKIRSTGPKKLAEKWIASRIDLKESTLSDIIRRKPKGEDEE